MLFLYIKCNPFYCMLFGNQSLTKRPNSNQRSIFLSLQQDNWQAPFDDKIHLFYWRQVLYMHFELNYVCGPPIFYKDIPIIYEIFYVLLPELYFSKKSGIIKLHYKRYKRVISTYHTLQKDFSSDILKSTYCLLICWAQFIP